MEDTEYTRRLLAINLRSKGPKRGVFVRRKGSMTIIGHSKENDEFHRVLDAWCVGSATYDDVLRAMYSDDPGTYFQIRLGRWLRRLWSRLSSI